MTEFMRPTVTTEEVNDTVARYIVEPLERGYGNTLGNSMRRVLLSSLDGAKATAIQIEGVQHEFTTAEGVIEDIADIVLNVKGLVFSQVSDEADEATAHVFAEGPCTVTGADLEVPGQFNLVNPDHVIATVADGGQLDMTIRIGVGRGYVSAERNKRTEDPIGIIHVDSLFSPVRRCTMNVTDTRVGQRTDYDKLVLEVETDGSLAPRRQCAARPTSSTSTWARFWLWLPPARRKRARLPPSSRRRVRSPTPSLTSRSRIWTFPSAPTTA